VAERTKEIGVRRALGAGVGSVFADVLRRGLVPVLVGLGAGLLLALGLGPLIRSLLYGVKPRDPVTFGLPRDTNVSRPKRDLRAVSSAHPRDELPSSSADCRSLWRYRCPGGFDG